MPCKSQQLQESEGGLNQKPPNQPLGPYFCGLSGGLWHVPTSLDPTTSVTLGPVYRAAGGVVTIGGGQMEEVRSVLGQQRVLDEQDVPRTS